MLPNEQSVKEIAEKIYGVKSGVYKSLNSRDQAMMKFMKLEEEDCLYILFSEQSDPKVLFNEQSDALESKLHKIAMDLLEERFRTFMKSLRQGKVVYFEKQKYEFSESYKEILNRIKQIGELDLMRVQSTTQKTGEVPQSPKTGEALHESTIKHLAAHSNDIKTPVKEAPEQPHHEKSGRLKEEAAQISPKQEALLKPNPPQDNTTRSPRGTQHAVQQQQSLTAEFAHVKSERDKAYVTLEGLQRMYNHKQPVDLNYCNQLKLYIQQCDATLRQLTVRLQSR